MGPATDLHRLHYLRQVPYEGLGVIGEWAAARGVEVTETRAYDGETPPPPADLQLLVVLGGPMGVCHADVLPAWLGAEFDYVRDAVAAGTQVLGICLGAQMLARALGARVARHAHPEIGWHELQLVGDADELAAFGAAGVEVMEWHFDTFELPEGARHLARSAGCEQQAFAWGDNVLALQFHPEFVIEEARAIAARDGEPVPGPYAQPLARILDADRFARLRQATFEFLDSYASRRFPAIAG